MAEFTASDNRCDVCLNSRAVVSENGIHYVCCLSQKKALDCLIGTKDYYDGYSDCGRKENDMPRFIDADALLKRIYPMGIGDGKYTINAKAVKFAIDNAPPPPMSHRGARLSGYTTISKRCLKKEPKPSKRLRGEIFEEIEALIKNQCLTITDERGIKGYVDSSVHFALSELKKKYTEGDANGGEQ